VKTEGPGHEPGPFVASSVRDAHAPFAAGSVAHGDNALRLRCVRRRRMFPAPIDRPVPLAPPPSGAPSVQHAEEEAGPDAGRTADGDYR